MEEGRVSGAREARRGLGTRGVFNPVRPASKGDVTRLHSSPPWCGEIDSLSRRGGCGTRTIGRGSESRTSSQRGSRRSTACSTPSKTRLEWIRALDGRPRDRGSSRCPRGEDGAKSQAGDFVRAQEASPIRCPKVMGVQVPIGRPSDGRVSAVFHGLLSLGSGRSAPHAGAKAHGGIAVGDFLAKPGGDFAGVVAEAMTAKGRFVRGVS